jgi:hypothetical protein
VNEAGIVGVVVSRRLEAMNKNLRDVAVINEDALMDPESTFAPFIVTTTIHDHHTKKVTMNAIFHTSLRDPTTTTVPPPFTIADGEDHWPRSRLFQRGGVLDVLFQVVVAFNWCHAEWDNHGFQTHS